MFLRKNRKSAYGEVYEYCTLCETVRAELGPRQRVVATLGKLSEQDLAAGWEDIEALPEGRKSAPWQLLLEKGKDTQNPPSCAQWELADGDKRYRSAACLSPENRPSGGASVGVLFKPGAVAAVGDVDAWQRTWE
jgi:hypothetical protein